MAPPTEPIGPFPPGADPDSYDRLRRRVLWKFPTGLYLIGSREGERRNLMTANWVVQLALSPKLVGVSVEAEAATAALISGGAAFTVALVGRSDRALVRKFVKPAVCDPAARTLNGIAYLDAPVTGCPVPAAAVAYVDCRLENEVALGSHHLFVGEVVDAEVPGGEENLDAAEVLRIEDTRMNYGG